MLSIHGGVWMACPQHLFADCQSALMQRPCTGEVTLRLKQGGKVAEAPCRIGMVRAERLFADCQSALVERPRPGEVASCLKQDGKVAEAHRGIGMVGTKCLLTDRQ